MSNSSSQSTPSVKSEWHRHAFAFVSLFGTPLLIEDRAQLGPFQFCDICGRVPDTILGRTQIDPPVDTIA